jgi:adenylate cyclase
MAWSGSALLAAIQFSFRDRREQHEVRRVFQDMLGDEVFDEVWRQKEFFLEHGRVPPQLATVTVLMSDLKGFSGAGSVADPVLLMDWINDYMGAMARIVQTHRGVIDDYAGDGLKADFGIPPRVSNDEMDRDAQNAVRSALAMAEGLEGLNRKWRGKNLPEGRVRGGIHTGVAAVGMLGTGAGRIKYTSIGDTVNAASRLESLDKEDFETETALACRILISEATRLRLGGLFETRDLGRRTLRGLEKEVQVFQVLGEKPAPDQDARRIP